MQLENIIMLLDILNLRARDNLQPYEAERRNICFLNVMNNVRSFFGLRFEHYTMHIYFGIAADVKNVFLTLPPLAPSFLVLPLAFLWLNTLFSPAVALPFQEGER